MADQEQRLLEKKLADEDRNKKILYGTLVVLGVIFLYIIFIYEPDELEIAPIPELPTVQIINVPSDSVDRMREVDEEPTDEVLLDIQEEITTPEIEPDYVPETTYVCAPGTGMDTYQKMSATSAGFSEEDIAKLSICNGQYYYNDQPVHVGKGNAGAVCDPTLYYCAGEKKYGGGIAQLRAVKSVVDNSMINKWGYPDNGSSVPFIPYKCVPGTRIPVRWSGGKIVCHSDSSGKCSINQCPTGQTEMILRRVPGGPYPNNWGYNTQLKFLKGAYKVLEKPPVYKFEQGKGTPGGDIRRVTGQTVAQLQDLCNADPACLAFSTHGILKKSVRQPSSWTNWSTDPNKGTYFLRR